MVYSGQAPRHHLHHDVSLCFHRPLCGGFAGDQRQLCSPLSHSTAALLAANLTLCCCLLQTVTAADAIAEARPLAAQPVRKDKVWLLLAGGAAALFGGTIVLENNEQLFPAIARANKAMARSREQQQVHSNLVEVRSPSLRHGKLTLSNWLLVLAARTTAKASD